MALWLILLLAFVAAFLIMSFTGEGAGNLSKFRVPVLVFFVIPLSAALRTFNMLRQWMRSHDPAGHEERVQRIVDDVKRWNAAGRKQKMRTARPNWAAMSTKLSSNKGDAHRVHTLHLDRILSVDTDRMEITAEPGVTMGEITHRLLPMGLALTVQVEMESISIGGITLGFGMETNSHRVGLFMETIKAFEFVTADGEVKKVTAESDPEVFYALPFSHGSFGFLTSVTASILRVKPYMHVEYIPTFSRKELRDKMVELATSDNAPEFLEATVYAKEQAVIQVGNFSEKPADDSKINAINRFWKPFYFRWVETFLKKGRSDEYIPLEDYYHRFTRSIFWELEDMIPFSNHPIYRCLWGWLGAPEVSLLKLFQGPVIRKASVYAHVVQESIMPVQVLDEGIERFDEWFGCYPLLVFPQRYYRREKYPSMFFPRPDRLLPGKDYGVWVDLGAYGVPRKVKAGQPWDAKAEVRKLEHWTRDIGGWQAAYTDIFATKDEFRAMFNHSLLDKVRRRLNAEDAFPEVYDKIRPEAGIVDLSDIEAEGKTNGKH